MGKCPVCGPTDEDERDFRTLRVQNFYDLSEASDLLEYNEDTKLYSIRTCKECRADFIMALRLWTEGLFTDREHRTYVPGVRDIPVRQDGATKFVTTIEYEALYPGRDPIRIEREDLE